MRHASAKTLIGVNIGNTHTSAAVLIHGRSVRARRWQAPTSRVGPRLVRSWIQGFGRCRPAGAVLASVVPAAARIWRAALRSGLDVPVVEVRHDVVPGVRFDYPRPDTLGADRLAVIAAVAAGCEGPVIAIDAGTATTFDALAAGGRYLGGVIAPGPALFLDYLADRTAQLPRLALVCWRQAIGKSTEAAMRIGADAGYEGMLRGIVGRMRSDARLRGARLLATGGAAGLVRRALSGVRVDPDLIWRGLALIYRKAAAPPR